MRNLLIIFVLFFFSCTAGEAQTVATCKSQDLYITPLSPQIVDVIFKIDSLGKADVLEIRSKQLEYQELVLKRLKNISLGKGDALIGKTLHYRFDFSSLEVES